MHDTPLLEQRRAPNHGRGRKPGATNIITSELKTFWHRFFSSPAYRENAMRRILNGTASHLEGYLLARIYGKPTERLAISVEESQEQDLSLLSLEELLEMNKTITADLEEAAAIKAALPAEYRQTSPETSVRPTDSAAESAADFQPR